MSAPRAGETRLLFHVGMAKTGSSSLQRAFLGSEDHLASKGVLYPRDPARPKLHNHKLIAAQIAPLARLPRHMARLGDQERVLRDSAGLVEHIRGEVARRRPALLLLSSETMFARIRRPRDLRRTIEALGTAPPVFAAYLRRPSERYVSGLQQVLRSSHELVQPRPPSYRAPIEGYEALFGAGRLRLHVFHRGLLRDGDVVADFVARHLAEHGVEAAALAQVGERNVSVSAESMTVLRAFRAAFRPDDRGADKVVDALRRTLREADAAAGAPRPRLRPGIAEMVDHASDEPLWLRDAHGVVFPGFDYRPLEEGRRAEPPERALALEEIVVVDPERRRAVLEHLRGTEWARPRRRRRWVEGMLRGEGGGPPAPAARGRLRRLFSPSGA